MSEYKVLCSCPVDLYSLVLTIHKEANEVVVLHWAEFSSIYPMSIITVESNMNVK
jgi:hypothetical protein